MKCIYVYFPLIGFWWFLIVLFSKCIFYTVKFYFLFFYFERLCVVVLIRGRIPRPTTWILFQFSLDSFHILEIKTLFFVQLLFH